MALLGVIIVQLLLVGDIFGQTSKKPTLAPEMTTTAGTTIKTKTTTTILSTNNATIAVIFDCSFEDDWCGFTNDSQGTQIQWSRFRGNAPGMYTGPDWDHTSGEGSYLLLDAAGKLFGNPAGSLARAVSPEISTIGYEPCVNISFWYHAYGFHLGRLSAFYKTAPYSKNNWTSMFETKGQSQLTSWRLTEFSLIGVSALKIAFEATLGEGPQGSYAIDDVEVKTAECPMTTQPPTARRQGGQFVYQTTTSEPAKPQTETWVIALVIILVVFALIGAAVITFVVIRQRKLKRLKEQEDAEKAARLRQEIEQYGAIKARLDRTISGRIRAISNGIDGNNARPFDRPALDRRFVSSAAATTRPSAPIPPEDDDIAQRSEAVFSIIDNSYSRNRPDGERSEAVFDIIESVDRNRAVTAPSGPRTKSAVARGVHRIEDVAPPSSRLPPLTQLPGGIPASPAASPRPVIGTSVLRRPSGEPDGNANKMPRTVRFIEQSETTMGPSNNKPSTAAKLKGKSADKIDPFED